MVDDPDPALLPPGSPAAAAARLFDSSYGNLLRALQQVMNGAPERLNEAIGVMFSLEVQARELLRIPIAAGSPQTAGPSFQAT
jgi:hypothetical protein